MNFESLALTETKLSTADGWRERRNWILARGKVYHDLTELIVLAKVRQMYFDNFREKDLHLFLGTTREWHGRGKNPFVVIGAFYPPIQNQPELF